MAELHDHPSQRAQRTNDRTLHFWRALCGERPYPAPGDVVSGTAAGEATSLRPNVFVLYFDGQPLESVFTFGSEVLDTVCGAHTGGHRLADCLPGPLRDSMLGFVRALAKARKPIAVSSSFTRDEGGEVLYRSIYLPLSGDQQHVEHLLGAFSYKEVPAAAEAEASLPRLSA